MELVILQRQGITSNTVEFEFTVYDYDPQEKGYYKAFHDGGEVLAAQVQYSGGELLFHINEEASQEVSSPLNFDLGLTLAPAEQQASLHVAHSKTNRYVRRWGVGNSPPPAPVPIPGAVWLFGTGLIGLLGMMRRKRTPLTV